MRNNLVELVETVAEMLRYGEECTPAHLEAARMTLDTDPAEDYPPDDVALLRRAIAWWQTANRRERVREGRRYHEIVAMPASVLAESVEERLAELT